MADQYARVGGLIRIDGPANEPSLRTVGGTEGVASTTHSTQHKHGGTDEVATATAAANAIPKADGSGKLDTWISDASTTVKGKVELATDGEATAGLAVQGDDARLTNSRSPTIHASTHQSGGSDLIKLDDLAATDDNTDLNSTTASHGLLPKLGGGSSNFLRADGTWASPGAASTNIKETEIDFGTTSSHGATFLVTDADVAADSQIMAFQSYQPPTSRDRDENEMDQLHVIAYPVTASTMSLRVAGLTGRVHGKFKINYLIG